MSIVTTAAAVAVHLSLLFPTAPNTGARQLPPAPAAGATHDTPALFAEHCAKCHGEKGDGQGWTELDRPARSFLDGGFSYGNTRGALQRSIRHGIPGTPMPAFPDEVLTSAQREALADFVIALGPPGTIQEPGASVLRVEARPVVVRGLLPSLDPTDAAVPRGLLIGFPSGTTFEFRGDDVALRAVRQGEFVDRRDWGDRGGIALAPLGQVTFDARASAASLVAANGHPRRRALRGTEVQGDSVVLRTALVDGRGTELGAIDERLAVIATAVGPVPTRTLSVRWPKEPASIPAPEAALAVVAPEVGRVDAVFRSAAGEILQVRRVTEGLYRVAPRAASQPRVVHYVHAPRWMPALEVAVNATESAR